VRPYLVLAVLALSLTGCSSQPDRSADTTNPPPTTHSTTVPDLDQATPPAGFFDGLLAVDLESGDVLEFTSGSWSPIFDGPAYSDETATFFAETATRFSGSLVVSTCCEPVVGMLSTLQAGTATYFGYGTRPSAGENYLVSFKDLYGEEGTSLLVHRSTDPEQEVREIPLPSVAAHGSRIHIDGDYAFLTWSSAAEDGVWYLSRVDLRADSKVDLSPSVSLELPAKMDLAAGKTLALFSTSTTPSSLYDVSPSTFTEFDFAAAPSIPLPAATSSLALYGSDWIAVTASGVESSSEFFKAELGRQTLTWVGW